MFTRGAIRLLGVLVMLLGIAGIALTVFFIKTAPNAWLGILAPLTVGFGSSTFLWMGVEGIEKNAEWPSDKTEPEKRP